MHVAFALMLGVPMASMARRRWVKALWLRVPAARHVRRRGDREPLVVRRVHRRADGRRRGARGAAVRALAAGRVGVDAAALRRPPRSRPSRIPAASMPSPPLERARRPTAREYQALARNRLIESRLTPNAISLTGLVLCLVAAVARLRGLLLPRRARVHPRLGLRHARRALLAHVGQGHELRRVPRLDARPHGGGHRAHRRRVPVLPGRQRRRRRRGRRRGARLADGLLHPRARRGARRRVQGRDRRPRGARRDPVGRPGAREGRRDPRRRAARAGRLGARRAVGDHRRPAHLPRPQGARAAPPLL